MDPYSVLGVSAYASDDEIKKAYRQLSRKYHPDTNMNNPNKAEAEERFKEVQQAYETIIEERQQGIGYGRYGGNGEDARQSEPWKTAEKTRTEETKKTRTNNGDTVVLRAAVNLINRGLYREALATLESVPEMRRDSEWNFYAAIASDGVGDIGNAWAYIGRALYEEPGNMQYRRFQQHLEFGNRWYQARGGQYQSPYCGVGRWCISISLLNIIFSCCCFEYHSCTPYL